MKHIYRLTIILGISFAGELLHSLIPLPVPASIYGLALMLIALCTHIVPLEKVSALGHYLIEIMGVFFIPAGVALLNSWEQLKTMLIPGLVISLGTTIIVMAVSGHVTQAVLRADHKHKEVRE